MRDSPLINLLCAILLLTHAAGCTWSAVSGETRRTYVFGFGVVSQPTQDSQEAPRVWVQEMRGMGLGVVHGAGPSHVFCGAYECHETALPTGWQGVVEYKKMPKPAAEKSTTPSTNTP
jgi:hypothetical protein